MINMESPIRVAFNQGLHWTAEKSAAPREALRYFMKILKKRNLVYSAIVIFLFAMYAIADDTIWFGPWMTLDGKWYYKTIKESKLEKIPSWNPEMDPKVWTA
ncbi:hypothetical protein [uncultured Desulfosarcina sp.]|uniref:hypothetical protein n=1 Tax=uncultured Desulfosarcina sp. TaxID=218289 RepID=UPI0029C6D621|nr:hypothetical protein [uncultured Desulfosarcina sp.]